MNSSQFEQEQLAKLRLLANSYLTAITTLVANPLVEFTLDTGQGSQRVKHHDLNKLQETYGLLMQQIDAMSARCAGGGAVTITPGTAPWI